MRKYIPPFVAAAVSAVVAFSSVPSVFAAQQGSENAVKTPELQQQQQRQKVTYHISAKKISAKKDKGKVEVYRFDPSVYVVNQGDDVTFNLKGAVDGACPVVLEHYDTRGTIHQNQTLQLHFTANKPGIFKLVCTKHADEQHQGPMAGYLVVIPKNK